MQAFKDTWTRRLRDDAFGFRPGANSATGVQIPIEGEDGEEEDESEDDVDDLSESWVRRLRFDGGDGPGGAGPGAGLVA